MEWPIRKPNRVRTFDYAGAGYYFITLCTEDHRCILRRGAHCAPELPPLTEDGTVAEQAIKTIPAHYISVRVDKYVIMPNHIHIVLALEENCGRTMCAPTVSRIIKQLKETVTKRVGKTIWQKGFYDHIIRDEADYLRIWNYIDENPAKWAEDEYYGEAEGTL